MVRLLACTSLLALGLAGTAQAQVTGQDNSQQNVTPTGGTAQSEAALAAVALAGLSTTSTTAQTIAGPLTFNGASETHASGDTETHNGAVYFSGPATFSYAGTPTGAPAGSTLYSTGNISMKSNKALFIGQGYLSCLDSSNCTINAPTFIVNSSLAVNGALKLATITKTANFTFDATMRNVPANAASGAIVGTLPACTAANKGLIYGLKKLDGSANAVSYATTGSDLIDGAATLAITIQYNAASVQCSDTVGRWDRGF